MPDVNLNPETEVQEVERTDQEIKSSLSSFFTTSGDQTDNSEDAEVEPETEEVSEEEEVEVEDADNSDEDEDDTVVDELEESEEDEDEEDEEDSDDEEDEEIEEEELEEDSKESSYLYTDDEGKKVFLKFTDPETGESSTYLTREKAEEGMARHLTYIGELKAQIESERESVNSKINALENDLAFFQRSINKDEVRKGLINDKLPEKFKGLDPTTLSDEAEIKAFKNAILDAEIEVDREIRKASEERKEANEKAQKAQDEALNHIRSRSTDLKFFGFTNSEDRMTIRDKLTEKPEGTEYTHSDIAVSLSKAFGNKVADQYLKSVVSGQSETETSPKVEEKETTKKAPKKTVSKKKKVEAIKKKVKPKKKVKAPNNTSKKAKSSAKSIIANNFSTT